MDKKYEGKQITILVMNREGHTEHTCGFEDALDLIREEMGHGKWLRVVDDTGNSYVETSIATLTVDMDRLTDLLMNARTLTLQVALQGGIEEPTITIDGKVYPISQVKINTDDKGKVTTIDVPKVEEPKVTTGATLYADEDDETLIRVLTGDENEVEIMLNNAHGIEAVARGVAHLIKFLDTHWTSMRDGDMKVLQES